MEPTANPRHIDDLEINPADDGFIIYQPEKDRVHFLNSTAVLILELCNGNNSIPAIVDLLREAYGTSELSMNQVNETIDKLKEEGLLLS